MLVLSPCWRRLLRHKGAPRVTAVELGPEEPPVQGLLADLVPGSSLLPLWAFLSSSPVPTPAQQGEHRG